MMMTCEKDTEASPLDQPPLHPPPPAEERHPISELQVAAVWVLDLVRRTLDLIGADNGQAEAYRYAKFRLVRAIDRIKGTSKAGMRRCRVAAPGLPERIMFECRPGEERMAALAAVMERYVIPQYFAGFFPIQVEVLLGEADWTSLPAV